MQIIINKMIKIGQGRGWMRKGFRFSSQNHYQLLGVAEGASFKELKEQYLSKSKVYHPDVSPSTLEIYQNIQIAYKILATPDTRKKYDLSLGIQNSPWEKELIGSKFQQNFKEQQIYESLLQKNKQAKGFQSSLEQKLQQDFKKQIEDFHIKRLLKHPPFYVVLSGFGLLWILWTTCETLLLGYTGEVDYQLQKVHTQTALKIVPLFSR